MNSTFLSEKFSVALSYAQYVRTGTEEQQRRWQQVYETSALTEPQRQLVSSFARPMKILIVSGIWCGDCVQQCPLVQKIADANPSQIDLRLIDRDLHRDLSENLRINGGDRVPVTLFLAEDFELCAIFGERTLTRYRAIAARQLGPSCPIAILPPDQGEMAATLADWLNEVERIQWMLRISPRLRKLHND